METQPKWIYKVALDFGFNTSADSTMRICCDCGAIESAAQVELDKDCKCGGRFHSPTCTKLLDDESDYAHLDDAGTCTCGAERVAEPPKSEEK